MNVLGLFSAITVPWMNIKFILCIKRVSAMAANRKWNNP